MFQLWFGGFSREGGKGGGGSPAEEKISSTLTDLYFRPFLWTISAFTTDSVAQKTFENL